MILLGHMGHMFLRKENDYSWGNYSRKRVCNILARQYLHKNIRRRRQISVDQNFWKHLTMSQIQYPLVTYSNTLLVIKNNIEVVMII